MEKLQGTDPVIASDVEDLIASLHYDPHRYLGIHTLPEGKKVIRLLRPGAREVYFQLKGEVAQAQKVHPFGIFESVVPDDTTYKDYKVYHQNGLLAEDPYAFWPTFGEMDGYLFRKGVHYELYKVMGGRLTVQQGVKGVQFAVWAPSARGVALVADFNFWDGRANPMRSMGHSGVWELFVPGLAEGERYKFEIRTPSGDLEIKADPFALQSELRPLTASVIADVNRHKWGDNEWIQKRPKRSDAAPMLIYEVHLGSWRKPSGESLKYRQIADELALYCKEMGFTHVEIMPIAEHPLDESWGYQISGFFAVTSRYGTPEDFQYFVDRLHQEGIGVIVDWVPAHFPTDRFSLSRFDGTALYEHEDPRQGFHPHWSTNIFNYGRHEVSNFLIANALFWFGQMHIDGLRVDAVASMLYLDYGRNHGEWIPNRYGGNENVEAIEFLKHLNSIVHSYYPGVMTIAEESTAFTGITTPLEKNGLGFDYKWNMGWMNDTLRYFSKDPLFRNYHQNELTFGLLYAFSEKFILVLSHDEVVHGKRSLLSKMPGDYWQKFANLRLLYSYMICQPGKKMLFMGGELGQWNEWWCKEEIHWHLLRYPSHDGLKRMVQDINRLYLSREQFWTNDFDYSGFEWVDFSDTTNCVITYKRKSQSVTQLLCVHNFTPSTVSKYRLRLPHLAFAKEIFNTDNPLYGGSGKMNETVELIKDHEGKTESLEIILSPLATLIFEISYSL